MCDKPLTLSLLCIALIAPSLAHASVVISEIAWMGTSVSANAEWIELQNTDSTPVALSGWTITTSTGSPSIALTGSIAGSGFYLLERTSDTSVPSITADQIYSGALPNTGLTLTLKDQAGMVGDTVVGGADWKDIGGDNVTKHTPQRSGSSWSTAEPTPRATNGTGTSNEEDDGAIATSTDPLTPQPSVGGSAVVTKTPSNPIPRLYIDAGPGRVLTAGAKTYFTANAYDSYGTIRKDADIVWSFGDGASEDGDEVEHAFELPGAYTVAIHARAGPSDVVSLLAVQVLTPIATVTKSDASGVTVHNGSDTLLDLSSWKLVKEDTFFIIPRYTTLLPGQDARFASSITKLASTSATAKLLLPDGREAMLQETEHASTTTALITTPSAEDNTTFLELIPSAQLWAGNLGIQEVEEAPPQLVTKNISIYDPQTRAPSTLENPSVLGASVGLAVPPLLTSPWTLSFMGLLVAAATILVIL